MTARGPRPSVRLLAAAAAVLASLTLAASGPARAAAGPGEAQGRSLRADQELGAVFEFEPGQSIRSARAMLLMQSDGDLVIYDEFGRVRWATGTAGRGRTARFQQDGNFVVYSRGGRAEWASHTDGHPGAQLVVQDDGNVVIYDDGRPIWATGTEH
ncbi:hypothetical protein AB0K43_27360 [Kitasatospora sp. NPDC049258]|uniref:hypothetical protein n=1 Tax=Kitasatospora sp. NPDC049258 TaxID=3155394 RepID=UPI003446C3ED